MAGCGGNRDDAPTTEEPAPESNPILERADTPDRKQIAFVADEWSGKFSLGSEGMCEYLAFDIKGSCDIYTDGPPRSWQTSFSNAEVTKIEIDGKHAIAQFDNDQRVEFEKAGSGIWFVSNVGGALAGK